LQIKTLCHLSCHPSICHVNLSFVMTICHLSCHTHKCQFLIIVTNLSNFKCHNQRWDMYVFIREPKFSSIGYKVGARFRLSYKYINVPCLTMTNWHFTFLFCKLVWIYLLSTEPPSICSLKLKEESPLSRILSRSQYDTLTPKSTLGDVEFAKVVDVVDQSWFIILATIWKFGWDLAAIWAFDQYSSQTCGLSSIHL
jgi:hypothetical protein